jgi:hemoglobin-like flavoprotein
MIASLTTEQKTLIHKTFRKVTLKTNTFADLFYTRLFELDPELRPMFKNDMREQQKKFMQTVGTLVASLDLPDKFEEPVQQLGKRHTAYHVEKKHYDTVGEALMWALERVLGDDFTEEAKTAWTGLYTYIAQTAIAAAEETK